MAYRLCSLIFLFCRTGGRSFGPEDTLGDGNKGRYTPTIRRLLFVLLPTLLCVSRYRSVVCNVLENLCGQQLYVDTARDTCTCVHGWDSPLCPASAQPRRAGGLFHKGTHDAWWTDSTGAWQVGHEKASMSANRLASLRPRMPSWYSIDRARGWWI